MRYAERRILIRHERSAKNLTVSDRAWCAVRTRRSALLAGRKKRFSHSNCGARRRARKTNQLIVGPPRWAYQVLGATLGERFMENPEVRISIDRYFIAVIA